MDVQIAYYAFVNHGRFPSETGALSDNERMLIYAMAVKEISKRPKN